MFTQQQLCRGQAFFAVVIVLDGDGTARLGNQTSYGQMGYAGSLRGLRGGAAGIALTLPVGDDPTGVGLGQQQQRSLVVVLSRQVGQLVGDALECTIGIEQGLPLERMAGQSGTVLRADHRWQPQRQGEQQRARSSQHPAWQGVSAIAHGRPTVDDGCAEV